MTAQIKDLYVAVSELPWKHFADSVTALPLAALLLGGCGSPGAPEAQQPSPTAQPPAQAQEATIAPAPAPAPQDKGKAVIHTSEGPIAITFFPDIAPQTVEHIAGLMQAGCYESVDIFRLEPGFVVQVAPVSNRSCHPNAMSTVPGEFDKNRGKHIRLALSLARWDDPNSGTSSWSIMLGPAPSMDGEFAVFGRVTDGEDTIRKIEAIGSTKGENGMSRLNRKVSIEKVELSESPIADQDADQTAE